MLFNRLNIQTRLILIFLLIGIAPFIVIGSIGIRSAYKALSENSFEKLISTREIKSEQIKRYYKGVWDDIEFLSTTPVAVQAMSELEKGFSYGMDSPEYNEIFRQYTPPLDHYWEMHNYYDLFFISAAGDIIYSSLKERDFGTNLLTGEFSDQKLGELFRLARHNPVMTDYTYYEPSGGIAAAFIGAPVNDSFGNNLGVVAVQLSTKAIDEILDDRHGLKKDINIYLVGADKFLRSDLPGSEDKTTLSASMNTKAISDALKGLEGARIIYTADNKKVLSAYAPLKVNGLDWAILVEIGADKAFAQANAMLKSRILIGLSIAIIVFFLGWKESRKISRPLEEISNAAVAMSTGDIDQKIVYEGPCEVGILADSFRKLIDYIREISTSMQRMSQRDLTVEIIPKSEKDILGISFQSLYTNYNGIIKHLNYSAHQLVNTANELAAMSDQMSNGTNEQIHQIEQVSAAINEIASTIVQTSQNAGKASDLSTSASQAAQNGSRIVNETITSMRKITDSTVNTGAIIGDLAEASHKIAEIISVIDDIADQTNLLALNAAIEAARAGDQGRGFAVVADEVRKLAERTGQATGQITEMIVGIQTDSNNAVLAMHDAGNLVGEGQTMANRAGESLQDILEVVQSGMDMIKQIAAAAEQQSVTAEQISRNIENISSVTLENASGAKQTSKAAERLNIQAEDLQSIVADFKLRN